MFGNAGAHCALPPALRAKELKTEFSSLDESRRSELNKRRVERAPLSVSSQNMSLGSRYPLRARLSRHVNGIHQLAAPSSYLSASPNVASRRAWPDTRRLRHLLAEQSCVCCVPDCGVFVRCFRWGLGATVGCRHTDIAKIGQYRRFDLLCVRALGRLETSPECHSHECSAFGGPHRSGINTLCL